jgi:hypothetical protein
MSELDVNWSPCAAFLVCSYPVYKLKYIRAKSDLAGKLKRDQEIGKKVAELIEGMKHRKKRWR